MSAGKTPFSRQVILLLVVAGVVVLWDLFSGHGGMKSGMISILAVALTILLLGSMYMGGAHYKTPEPPEAPVSSEEGETEDTLVALSQNDERQTKAKLN